MKCLLWWVGFTGFGKGCTDNQLPTTVVLASGGHNPGLKAAISGPIFRELKLPAPSVTPNCDCSTTSSCQLIRAANKAEGRWDAETKGLPRSFQRDKV